MAFAQADFARIAGTLGADGYNIWSYVTDDDLFDSFTNQTANTTYFANAYLYFNVRNKDIVLVKHASATKPVVTVGATDDWDANGATCVLCE